MKRTDQLILLGLLAAGGYLIYQARAAGKGATDAIASAYNGARNTFADAFYDWWGPDENFGPGKFLTVTLVEPGAPRHAIGADQISQGQFRYGGKTYRIADNAQGQHFGVPVI